MTGRHPALGDDAVEGLRAWMAGAPPIARRAAGVAVRPVRRAVLRFVDPSLRAALDQLHAEAGTTAGTGQAETEVLRAELSTTHAALEALGIRVAALEERLARISSSDRQTGPSE